MTDFVSDGQPIETPVTSADESYARTPPTWSRAFGALFGEESTTGMLGRAVERGQYAGASDTDRALYNYGIMDSGAWQTDPSALNPIQTPTLSAKEVNDRFAPAGTSITDVPMREGVAHIVGKEKQAEIERQSVISRFDQAHSWPVRFGTGAAAFLLDPINASTTFLPGVGEETTLAGLGRAGLGSGLLARTTARVVAGGTAGALAQAPLSAAKLGLGREEASDYDLRQAFTDMSYSAAGGAIFHAGLGAAGDYLRARRAAAAASPSPDDTLTLVRGLERSGDNAVSPAGAIGRYQIMPGTAREYGFDPSRLKDPAYNEKVAGAVLADLRKRYGGNTDAMLIAYNAGPGRADAWLKSGRDVSALPAETQAYLARAHELAGGTSFELADASTKADAMRAAVSQVADGREVDVAPVFDERAGKLDPANIAQRQRQLYDDGFAPGFSQAEFDQARENTYGGETQPTVRMSKSVPPQQLESVGEQPASPVDRELAALEQRQAAREATGNAFALPEEKAELESTAGALDQAKQHEMAYAQAAECLSEAGV